MSPTSPMDSNLHQFILNQPLLMVESSKTGGAEQLGPTGPGKPSPKPQLTSNLEAPRRKDDETPIEKVKHGLFCFNSL